MSSNDQLDKRISELRREAEQLARARREKSEGAAKSPEPPPGAKPGPEEEAADADTDWQEHAEDLVRELETNFNELAETAEGEMKKHPFLAAAAAFALGLVIGRLIR